MQNITTIFRREFGAYFNSPIAYIFIIAFLVLNAGLFMTTFFLSQAADVMGIPIAGRNAEAAAEAAAQQVADWVSRMQLPQRLRDIGVQEAELPELARLAMANRTVQNNPRLISDAAQIEALLRQAW